MGVARTVTLGSIAVLLVSLVFGGTAGLAEPVTDMEVFVRSGCPHCEEAERFLEQLQRERPSLHVTVRDVAQEPAALEQLRSLLVEQGIQSVGVPTFRIGADLIVGFLSPETTGNEIRARLGGLVPRETYASTESIHTRWFGEVRVSELGLLLFTIVIGLLDGVNPCAMWVLLFLLSLLVNLQDRTRMALIAGTFVAVSGLIYFAFMAAWLNVFLLIGFSRALQVALGAIALLIGAVHVKDFFARGKGLSLSIPDTAKPGLYARVRGVLLAENLGAALTAIVALAGLVNLVELLCTAGLPALYTQILTLQRLPTWQYYGYLGLYNLAYVVDDGVMVGLAVFTLSRRKLQEAAGRWLKLISGLVMAGLGVVLLLRPAWLM